MSRIGYASGAFDLFHIGHLNLLRQAKTQCDFLIAGVASDEVLRQQRGIYPVVPFAERLEIVGSNRFADLAYAAMTIDKVAIWRELQFDVLFKGDDWQGTDMGRRLERDFTPLGVEIVYFPYTRTTSSTALRRTLKNIDAIVEAKIHANDQELLQMPVLVGDECLGGGQNRVD